MAPINLDPFEDASLKALPRTIEDAEDGDVHAKRQLLEIFRAMADAGTAPYPALLAYLSRHLTAALNQERDGAKVLGRALLGGPITGGRTRSLEDEQRDMVLAVEVNEAKAARPTEPELDIFASVATLTGATEDVVAHAWRRFKDTALIKGWPHR